MYTSGHGVTANMLVLGTSDSGFESQCPDRIMKHTHILLTFGILIIIALIIARLTIFALPERDTPTFEDAGDGVTIIQE